MKTDDRKSITLRLTPDQIALIDKVKARLGNTVTSKSLVKACEEFLCQNDEINNLKVRLRYAELELKEANEKINNSKRADKTCSNSQLKMREI